MMRRRGDEKEEHAQNQIEPQWRQIAGTLAAEKLPSQEPRFEQQRRKGFPDTRICVCQIFRCLACEVPDGMDRMVEPLTAISTEVTGHRGPAVGAGGCR